MTREEFIAENLDIFYEKHKEYMKDIINKMVKEDSYTKEDWKKEFNTQKEKETMKEIIENKIKIRQEHWKRYEESWSGEHYDMIEPSEIDELAKEIIDLLTKNHDSLPVDFVIESLTHLGYDPSILYDDNGNFAISSGGICSISTEDSADCSLSFFVEKRFWKPTIREALKVYFEDDED